MSGQRDMLLGAVVADAASLGVHWIYDPARLTEIAARQGGRTAFTPVDPANYENVMGYFAHGQRHSGMLTQYGEALLLAVRSINATGGFDVAAHQAAFAAHFGAGGTYVGYIDRPTRGALANIAADQTATGIDDDQLQATARLPAIMARYAQGAEQDKILKTAQEVTNGNAIAAAYTAVFASLINQVLADVLLDKALTKAAAQADPVIKDALQAALDLPHNDSTACGETTGRACHLPMAGPLAFHILKHATCYTDAIERNNRAGGDNAGRAILIGAVMGAVHGVPVDWTLALDDAAQIYRDCSALAL